MEIAPKLPQHLPAEKAVLGAMIIDRTSLETASTMLTSKDFLLPVHQRIFESLSRMLGKGVPVDLVTLTEESGKYGELEEVGGAAYLADLIDGLPKSNVSFHVGIVKKKAILRRIAYTTEKLTAEALEGDVQPSTLIARATETFSNLAKDALPNSDSRICRWDQIPTLDLLPDVQSNWIIPGLIPESAVVLLAGEPASFKTWLSQILARGISVGGAVLGRQAIQRDVLFLDRENPVAVVRDRARILRMTSSSSFRYWGGWERDLPPLIGDSRLIEIARDRKPMMFFDSFLRFHEGDENSAKDMAPVMANLRELANLEASPFVIHHTPKNDAYKFRGSTDILAAVDLAYSLSRNHKTGDLYLKCFKNRFGQEFEIVLRPDLENADIVVVQSATGSKDNRELEALQKIIRATPEMNQTEIIKKSGMPQKRCAELLKKGLDKRWWSGKKGLRNAIEFTVIECPYKLED